MGMVVGFLSDVARWPIRLDTWVRRSSEGSSAGSIPLVLTQQLHGDGVTPESVLSMEKNVHQMM